MKPIFLPSHYNYIGAFLTLRCNMACIYCINKQGDFKPHTEMSSVDWIRGLTRIQTRDDLPITLQGGEPTLYHGFYTLASVLHSQGKRLNLLTNGEFDFVDFLTYISHDTFKHPAPYASIRFSYHDQDELKLANKVKYLTRHGYSVGIWGLSISDNRLMNTICQCQGIDFRVKEFLDRTHGTYKFPNAINGPNKKVLCSPSELLIAPSGFIYRCHADLYAARDPIGHILDDEVKFPRYLPCENYGSCNPCDIKLKTNRFQEGGHCSVDIKELE